MNRTRKCLDMLLNLNFTAVPRPFIRHSKGEGQPTESNAAFSPPHDMTRFKDEPHAS